MAILRTLHNCDVFRVLMSTRFPKTRHCRHSNNFLNLTGFWLIVLLLIKNMTFSKEQKVLIVKLWYKFESPVEVRRKFCNEMGLRSLRDGPSRHAIYRIVHHFEHKFSVEKKNKGYSGRSPLKTKDANKIAEVQESVNQTPGKSIRQRSSELDVSRMSLQRILRRELDLFPYIISVRHVLTDHDRTRRRGMCQWTLDRMTDNPD